jgi:hypothetical protein
VRTYPHECWGWLPNSSMAQPRRESMAARGGLSHLLGTLEDLRWPSTSFGEWIWMVLPIGAPRGCIYSLGEPWGVLHVALHWIILGREANLVSINSASSRFSSFAALPYRHHISHVRTPNNTNSVSRLCATKFSSTLVFIAFLGNEILISWQGLYRISKEIENIIE